jgi:putative ABC transport system ATP-binding protein
MKDPVVEAVRLRKHFGHTEALHDVDFTAAAGEVVAVTGPSGSGKSTLLLCLAGILRPDGGEVRYTGQRLDHLSEHDRTVLRRRSFGVVLQFGQLVPELTAEQNVMLPFLLDRRGRRAARSAADEWLERLGASGVARLLPGEMSGGQAQRVAVARALVTEPAVVFADEPTGALDTVGGERLLEALLGAVRGTGASVVLVTHDNRVAACADREVVLRDGRTDGAGVGR